MHVHAVLNVGSWEAGTVGYWARRHHGEMGRSMGIPSAQWVFLLHLLALLSCIVMVMFLFCGLVSQLVSQNTFI